MARVPGVARVNIKICAFLLVHFKVVFSRSIEGVVVVDVEVQKSKLGTTSSLGVLISFVGVKRESVDFPSFLW